MTSKCVSWRKVLAWGVRAITGLAAMAFVLSLGADPASATLPGITFEAYPVMVCDGWVCLPSSRSTVDGMVITNQYVLWGVVFVAPAGLQLQIVTPTVGTRSPPRALGLFGIGTTVPTSWGRVGCATVCMGTHPIEIRFSSAKKVVGLYTGLHSPLGAPLKLKARLIAFDENNRVIARSEASVSVGINTPLRVTSSNADIKSVKLSFEPDFFGSATVPLPVIDSLFWQQ